MESVCKIVRFFTGISIVIFVVGMIFDFIFPIQAIPLIKKEEFPFVLKYEINGERQVVKDTLVCRFNGYMLNANDMRCKRKWTSYLKSGKDGIILFKADDIEVFYAHKGPNVFGAFYMGDTEIYSSVNDVFPNAWYITKSNDKRDAYIISAEEMMEKYNIKILNYSISPPIKNIFLNVKFILIGQAFFMIFIYAVCMNKLRGRVQTFLKSQRIFKGKRNNSD